MLRNKKRFEFREEGKLFNFVTKDIKYDTFQQNRSYFEIFFSLGEKVIKEVSFYLMRH